MSDKTEMVISSANFEWNSMIRDVVANLRLIVLAILIGIMGTYVLAHTLLQPQYTSTVDLAVSVKSSSNSALNDLSLSTQMAKILQEMFASDVLKEQVAKQLGMEQLEGEVETKLLGETNIFSVSVTAGSPRLAYDLLVELLKTYPQFSEYIFANAEVRELSVPRMPREPSRDAGSVISLAIVGAVMGFLMLLAILLLSFLRDTVKTERAFRERVDGKLLATVPHERKPRHFAAQALKSDKAVLITNPAAGFLFTESFHKLATRISYLKRRHGYGIFLISSVAENEGKTSVAVNLAMALEEKGGSVLVVDCDYRKPALHKILDMTKREYRDAVPIPLDLRMYQVRGSKMYAAVNPNPQPGMGERMLSNELRAFLQKARTRFDYVILDTPPLTAGADAEALVPAADAAILVVRTDRAYVADINDALDALSDEDTQVIGCVLNDVYPVGGVFGMAGATDTGAGYDKGYGRYEKSSQTDRSRDVRQERPAPAEER